ncbi:hypothetical protein LEMA_P072570.1 [Plenodomus lingam JN3]|uniref:Erythromycin esterase n=1 Tax=Leptosphaeria maculans (strain JN3 / isolate v23.1.3 / race Av1-4-5-6-7-8) TaxID=985895 RepID=E4ZKF4_LEPMJ|nr:hypothetical protein LEMA_P072570.1 [Plenodomus lingam JN3]CBX91749.1 hypothetical protein LEMA_P072570.1 [Plenodomus lingam JN3]
MTLLPLWALAASVPAVLFILSRDDAYPDSHNNPPPTHRPPPNSLSAPLATPVTLLLTSDRWSAHLANMARRSARLQKAPTPSADTSMRSDDSWHTASSPHTELPILPEMPDLPDPGSKSAHKPTANRAASKLPQVVATPHKNKPSKAQQLAAAASSRTPKDRTPIKPPGQEMHPAHHHASTAKVLDEARWLGFQSLGAQTAVGVVGPGTPSKTPAPPPAQKAIDLESSPDFRFRFKSPFATQKDSTQDEAGLSPSSRNILRDAAISGTPGGGSRAIFGTTEFSTKADVSPHRKKAEAKGKIARFSDVHMAQFKKMDSIANHASAFRADPTRFKPVGSQSLKKSLSKTDLAKNEPNKLKRTQSKADLGESNATGTGGLKRTQSKTDNGESVSKIPATPLKRTQSKMDLTGSGLPRAQSTVRLVPPPRDGRPDSRDGGDNTAAKRVKRTEVDDASTTRPVSSEGAPPASKPTVATPARKITSQTALPRLAARLMTPTKASLARSQSAKVAKTTTVVPPLMNSPSTHNNIPSPSPVKLVKGPSTNNLFSPTNIGKAMRDGARDRFLQQANRNLERVRSILRTPSRKFSNDPTKIAAGTHMSPPPTLHMPAIPATAPVKKHVNFSSSTLGGVTPEELGKSPSPMKFRAGSEVPMGAVIYPTLQAAEAQYPETCQEEHTLTESPLRRLTFGGEAANHPRDFSFEAGKAVKFGPVSTGTIRMVRKSDGPSSLEGRKRKLETVQEASDKENDEPAEGEMRSAKKMRPTLAAPPKTPASASKLPRQTPGRGRGGGSAISKSRLNFLATPKRNKA